ncbi:hypothetical protein THAOC_12160, partial [Thalassiosira oceanica]
ASPTVADPRPVHAPPDVELLEHPHVQGEGHVGLGHDPADLPLGQVEAVHGAAVRVLERLGARDSLEVVEREAVVSVEAERAAGYPA